MGKLNNRFKKSFFIVNKIYLLLIIFFLFIANAALGFIGFLFTLATYIINIFKSKIPIEVSGDFHYDTHVYKVTNKEKLKMDIWYPNKNSNSYPVVYFAHGGGWISGFRNQPNNVSWCKFLASKGFAVVSIDYRYGLKNHMEDILLDYSHGLKFIRTRYKELNLDINNIITMGLSAGGHLTLLYSAYNSYKQTSNMKGIKGVVAYYSPSDLTDIFDDDNKSLFARFATKKTLDGDPKENIDLYRLYSPINWISSNMVKTLVVHGKEDTVVPFRSSVKLINKFKDFNIDYRFLSHTKGDHTFEFKLKDYKTVKIIEETVKFMRSCI
ncbi:alpha/beta hydrolase fold domain-containing protein [Dethiothermospora halolimnae]|uniref:alpha/beta hydrolase fold domain-containing protein n=1 Tax=Dethiothermospora halolimnae TaxID=3114390 RepID=UPI003CCC242F